MIFKDGLRKAGFFENNIYKKPLRSIKEFEDFEKGLKDSYPEAFRQEIKEYIGLLPQIPEEDDHVGREFAEVEQEDLMATN